MAVVPVNKTVPGCHEAQVKFENVTKNVHFDHRFFFFCTLQSLQFLCFPSFCSSCSAGFITDGGVRAGLLSSLLKICSRSSF